MSLIRGPNVVPPIQNYQDLIQTQEYTPLKEDKPKPIYYEVTDDSLTYYLNDGNKMPALAYNTSLGHMDAAVRILPSGHKLARMVQYALELGYRHVDTASVYRTESEVGNGIQYFFYNHPDIKRHDLFISTKLWNDAHERRKVVPTLQKSLRRLKLDYIDLYLIHFPFAYSRKGDIKMTDYLETWKGMQDAKEMNLAKSIGVANFNLSQMKRLWDKAKIKPAVLQIEVNPTLTQEELVDWCQEHGIIVVGFSPFGAIMRDIEGRPPIHADHPLLKLLSKKYKKTVPQILLRYLIERNIVPLPRSNNKARIKENMNILNFNLLPQEVGCLSSFNCNYRLRTPVKWYPHPHYPFEKGNFSEMHIKHIIEHSRIF